MKMTKREKWEIVAKVIADIEFEDGTTGKDFAEHEVELLNRKKSGPSKATLEKRATNKAIADEIVASLEPDSDYCIAYIQATVPSTAGFSTSKMVAILKIAIEDGSLVKDKVKGKTVYRLA